MLSTVPSRCVQFGGEIYIQIQWGACFNGDLYGQSEIVAWSLWEVTMNWVELEHEDQSHNKVSQKAVVKAARALQISSWKTTGFQIVFELWKPLFK